MRAMTRHVSKVALIASALIAGSSVAQAQTTIVFNDGSGGLSPGEVLIADFDTTTGGFTGSNANIYATSVPGVAAEPATGDQGDAFLAILAGGFAAFSFATPLSQFSFDYGSADTYNFIEIMFSDLLSEIYTGQQLIDSGIADGDQSAPRTNGRLVINGNGRTITGFRLTSNLNSFELDNVATISAVPEPAAWALMIIGFGAVGHSMRRRRRISYRFAQAV